MVPSAHSKCTEHGTRANNVITLEDGEPTCDCMSKLGFKTCNLCIEYQREHVFAIKETERRWRKALQTMWD